MNILRHVVEHGKKCKFIKKNIEPEPESALWKKIEGFGHDRYERFSPLLSSYFLCIINHNECKNETQMIRYIFVIQFICDSSA